MEKQTTVRVSHWARFLSVAQEMNHLSVTPGDRIFSVLEDVTGLWVGYRSTPVGSYTV